jgi:hypothetical protein
MRQEKLGKSIISFGMIEERKSLLKYLNRFLLGRCRIVNNGKSWDFFLPREKSKFCKLLKKASPGTIIDLSPIAICLIIDDKYMYTSVKAY